MNSGIHVAILFLVLSCHLTYTKAQFRVVNGVDISIEQSQHSVAIFYKKIYKCVGSLVNTNSVVTSGHCVIPIEPWNFVLVAGVADLRERNTEKRQQRNALHIHHDCYYNKPPGYMDIAVVKVDKDFLATDQVQPISLCESQLTPGTPMRISGWGSVTANIKIAYHHLRTAEMPIVDLFNCKHLYANKPQPKYLQETHICAGCTGSGSSYGDSGAGALVAGQLCAVVHGGSKTPGIPILFTNVTHPRVKEFLQTVL